MDVSKLHFMMWTRLGWSGIRLLFNICNLGSFLDAAMKKASCAIGNGFWQDVHSS
jgi:hypothetical protein